MERTKTILKHKVNSFSETLIIQTEPTTTKQNKTKKNPQTLNNKTDLEAETQVREKCSELTLDYEYRSSRKQHKTIDYLHKDTLELLSVKFP